MNTTRRKRALIIAGAGASLEFGAPSTAELSEFVHKKARTDSIMQHYGGEKAYEYIYEKLSCYLDDRAEPVNFEHVFHCAQEILANFFGPVAGSANEFRPILYPFVKGILASNDKAGMRELVRRIPEFLFSEISAVCDNPKISLVPLEDFPRLLRQDCCTRIYTTNYDDFILQAAPDLYHGFDPSIGKGPRPFKPDTFWDMDNVSSVFHLHGSIHFGFPLPAYPQEDLNALRWFDDRAEARLHYSYSGSQERRMDGSCYLPSALITGFDKLSRMQQTPQAHYYAKLAHDAMTADVVFVIGCGLADLHVNSRIAEARRRKPCPPIVLIDQCDGLFSCEAQWKRDRDASLATNAHCRRLLQ